MRRTIVIGCLCVLLIVPQYAFAEKSYADKKYADKKVVFIDSYHQGYVWSDGIADGITTVFEGTGVSLETIHMDTKRNTSEGFKTQAGKKAHERIKQIEPDLIIAADDNAFQYVIKPYYRDAEIPVVFCGLNWDVSTYEAPYSNTTGMIEVALIPQLLSHIERYAKGPRIGFLGVDVFTARKEAEYYNKLFNLSLREVYVSSFEEWKAQFVDLQEQVDVLIVDNNAGIPDWVDEEAKAFVRENTKIPTASIYSWMAEYVLLGLLKVEAEQGRWSAETALRIFDGEEPANIPLAKNKEGSLLLNLLIADELNIIFAPTLLKNAETIIYE